MNSVPAVEDRNDFPLPYHGPKEGEKCRESDAEHYARGKCNSDFKVWKQLLIRIGDSREGQPGGCFQGFWGVFFPILPLFCNFKNVLLVFFAFLISVI